MRLVQPEPAEPRITEHIIRAGLIPLEPPASLPGVGWGAGQRLDPLLRGEVMES